MGSNLVIVFIWLLFAVAVGAFAKERGRSGATYFILSLLISPIITFIIVLLSSKQNTKVDKQPDDLSAVKPCPYCGEIVRSTAIYCRFCKKDIGVIANIDITGDLHKQLQDAIYNKNEEVVKAILSTDIKLQSSTLPISHEDYVDLHGTAEIKKLIAEYQAGVSAT